MRTRYTYINVVQGRTETSKERENKNNNTMTSEHRK